MFEALFSQTGAVLDELVPPVCQFCGSPSGRGRLCRGCLSYFSYDLSLGAEKAKRVPSADGVWWLWPYQRAGRLVRRVKFGGDWHLRGLIRERTERILLEQGDLLGSVDAVTFVPMHWLKRVVFRPGNLAQWWARTLAEMLESHLVELFEVRFWKPELHRLKNKSERRKTIRGAFSLKNGSFRRFRQSGGKAVLLVDDIITTGTTLESLTRLLKDADPDLIVKVFCICG